MAFSDEIAVESRSEKRGFARIWLPAALCVSAITLTTVALLFYFTAAIDRVSFDRQQQLVATVVAQSVNRVAHDQESVTVWDESIVELRRPLPNPVWLDANMGVWLHSYFGVDAAYVLDRHDRPLYAMVDGVRAAPAAFGRIAETTRPMIAELRRRMRLATPETLAADVLSPGVADIVIADGHPAIISVKPVVSETGTIVQVPGTEFFHISVRRLDGNYVAQMGRTYLFDGARFSWADNHRPNEAAHPWRSRNGRIVGYFIWTAFAPGSSLFAQLAPVLLAALLFLGALVSMLVYRIVRRTRQLQDSKKAAQHLAFHDILTGLPNRALFDDRLDHALAIYRGTAEHRVALLYLDLDRFKKVNDTLGHHAGDELIREFARRLRAIIRVTDTAARLGGDEFAIIQTEVSSLAETESLCRRIIEAASAPFLIGGGQVFVGVSIGVSLAGKDGLDADELARKADIALYQSKASGRGRHKLFAATMDEPIRARQAAERDLRAAMDAGDQLSVVYQPKYSAASGAITGVEALVRWNHPENGEVPPAVFIPVAEETGLIESLGEWVLAVACRAALLWPIGTVSVNISPVQLRNPHFAYRVIGIIGESEIDPTRIELEITETALIESTGECAANLRMLRAFGVRIALDDFGTGYSSFSHLREFEVDRVKIDRTFVDKIDLTGGGSAIIQAIVDLARSTGLQTTAEGVETDTQKAYLQKVGCDELQGFLMARPMSAAEVDALFPLASHKPAFSQQRMPARTRRRAA